MKKLLLCTIVLLQTMYTVAASDGGGAIGDKLTPFKPSFISGGSIEFNPESQEISRGWVLAVFFQLPDADLQEMETLLTGIMGEYGKVVFLSGAPQSILNDYVRLLPADFLQMHIAFDGGNRIAKRVLPGNVVLPFAVLADVTGEIVWMGEPMEFADVFPAIVSGTYSTDIRKKSVALYAELAGAIRSGNFPNVRKTAEAIIAIEPANPTAVQALMFFLEQSGSIPEAWQVLAAALQTKPESLFLSMLALNFGARHSEMAETVLDNIRHDIFLCATDRQKLSAAFMLLNGYGFEIAAVDMASAILDTLPPQKSEVLEFKALCSYRQGDLAAAVKFQEAACAAAGSSNPDMQKRLTFYKTLAERSNK